LAGEWGDEGAVSRAGAFDDLVALVEILRPVAFGGFAVALDSIAELGARNVLITQESGCFALLHEEREVKRFRCVAPLVETLSSVGSGDVLLAGFLAARHAGKPIDEALRAAVAAGAASTLEVGAGRFDPREMSRLLGGVEVAELEPVVS